jgi:hypothetical protein
MHLIYCLINKSLKNDILNIGVTPNLQSLNKNLHIINNTTFLPTPYKIYLTKAIYKSKSVELVFSLLHKFGTHIKDNFFEVSLDFIKPLFDLIYDDIHANDDIYENTIHEKYRVIQGETEYIIPCAIDTNAIDTNAISSVVYDRLSRYSDLDL